MTEAQDISASISPEALKAFLTEANWNFARSVRQNAEIWRRGDDEVLVPLSSAAPDYGRRIHNVIEDLARHSDNTEEDFSRALMYVEDDVVDLRLESVKDVLPLNVAARVIEHARELIIASACSAIARKAYHGRSKPLKAKQAASIMGMGHTRRDCFVIPLVSPASALRPVAIGTTLEQPELDLGLQLEPTYFPRRVTGMMASALQSIQDLAVRPADLPDNDRLQRAVLEGLSADACEATADMISTSDAGSLDVTFRWALTAVPLRSASDVIDFPTEAAEAIRHVGSLLRNQVTIDDAVLYGYVTSLDRDADDPVGTVKVRVFVDSKIRPVKITLNNDFYHLACEANDLRMRVVVAGKLRRPSSGLLAMPEVDSFQMDNYLPMVTTDAWAATVVRRTEDSER